MESEEQEVKVPVVEKTKTPDITQDTNSEGIADMESSQISLKSNEQ